MYKSAETQFLRNFVITFQPRGRQTYAILKKILNASANSFSVPAVTSRRSRRGIKSYYSLIYSYTIIDNPLTYIAELARLIFLI